MMRSLLSIALLLTIVLPLSALARVPGPPEVRHADQARDLPQIRSSHVLRVLVNQSRQSSGEVKGEAIGVEYPRLRAFERYLNSHDREGRHIALKIIPKAKGQLIDALQRGEGDLVVPGELLATQSTSQVVASEAINRRVPLLLVGPKGEGAVTRLEQLSGRTVTLTPGSAASEAVNHLNQKLALRKRALVKVEWVDSSLAVEDVLEMVQAGIYPLTIVEQPIAERWSKVMPKLRFDPKVMISEPGTTHWFVRRDEPMLRAGVDDFLKTYRGPGNQDAAFLRVYRKLPQVRYPLAREDRQKLEKLRPVLQRNAREQGLDWLSLAALAFKESTLDPKARGAGGSTGLMQITRSAAQRVGVAHIQDVDNNVRASARYLALIRNKFFASSQLNERERMAFVLAAYNLGPERVQAMRAEARRRGLNPNQWFFQVERVAMEQVGMSAVSNINSVNKYYLAFDRERDSLEPKGRKLVSRH